MMFRRLMVAVICTAFMILPAQAKRVEPEVAQKLAERFAESKRGPQAKKNVRLKHTALKQVQRPAGGVSGTFQHSPPEDAPLYYVFNMDEAESGGFVIIAADDVVRPVLGYSASGTYDEDNLPPNFAYWMGYLSRQIAFAKEQGIEQSAATASEWAAATPYIPTTFKGDTLKTKWNQNAPYNNFIPTTTPNPNTGYGGKNATGCVATAMAQIMKYHEHPIRGVGQTEMYTTNSGILVPPIYFSSTDMSITPPEADYDWANMQNTYSTSTANTPENNAVATLMYHVGASVKMDYGHSSGASVLLAMNALATYFGYDKGIQYLQREDFGSETEWHKEMRKQLDNNMPILYRGEELGKQSGHAFICDAYDANGDYFHFNWGWGGSKDGWYLTTALDPKTEYGAFTDKQGIVINIKPDLTGKKYDLKCTSFKASATGSFTSIENTPIPEVYHNELFYVGDILLESGETTDFPGGRLGAVLMNNRDSSIAGVLGTYTMGIQEIPRVSYTGSSKRLYRLLLDFYPIHCRVPTSVPPGKYKLKIAYVPYTEVDNIWAIDIHDKSLWEMTYGPLADVDITVLDSCDITRKITDTRFREAVYRHIGKSDSDRIYCQDVDTITVLSLNEASRGIYWDIESLNGVEYFTALKSLDCSNNKLTRLDVSKNVNLQKLNISNNNFTYLNLENANLKELDCSENNLSWLNVSGLPQIERLDCRNNVMMNESNITGLPESAELLFWPQKSTDLAAYFIDDNFRAVIYELIGKTHDEPILYEDLFNNVFGNLNVSGRNIKSLAGIEYIVNIEGLDCSNNELTELDLSNNHNLWVLDCSNNKLTELKLANHTPWLHFMDCSNNQLTSLHIPGPMLKKLNCSNNNLTKIDVSRVRGSLELLDCRNNYMVDETDVTGYWFPTEDEYDFSFFWPQKPLQETAAPVIYAAPSPAHVVSFVSESGDVISLQLVQNGKSALPPKLTREGYALVWSADYSSVTEDVVLMAQWVETSTTAVLERDRIVPDVKPDMEVAVVVPVTTLQNKLLIGPNPVAKSDGKVTFFRQGSRIKDATLTLYDASGNAVNKVKIKDNAFGDQRTRPVGVWDLKDRRGRPVIVGTYLVRGVFKTSDGKKETVSLIVGVR